VGELLGLDRRPIPTEKLGSSTPTLKRQFQEAMRGLSQRDPAPQPRSRRRRSGDTGGCFKLAAANMFRQSAVAVRFRKDPAIARLLNELFRPAATRNSNTSPNPDFVIGIPDAPASIGELIRWLLANGYSMAAIRAMFPGLFPDSPPAEPPVWDALDWLHLWNWNEAGGTDAGYDDFHCSDQHHLFLNL
jgi:hypothetical protein